MYGTSYVCTYSSIYVYMYVTYRHKSKLPPTLTFLGTREVNFDDIPADAVKAIIAAMYVTKTDRQSPGMAEVFQRMMPNDVLGLLDFSIRLLMPWAGICYVRVAVETSGDVEMLKEVVAKNVMFGSDSPEEERNWKDIVKLAVCVYACLREHLMLSLHDALQCVLCVLLPHI
jgi:hypothetical protein